VSPFRPSFSPQPRVYPSASSRSALEHLPSRTNLVGPCPTPALTLGPSIACRLLKSLASLFATRALCFQQLAASFCKTPGVGGYLCDNSALSASLYPACPKLRGEPRDVRYDSPSFLPYAFRQSLCASLSTFRINTSKSVSKQMTLTPFRMNTCEKTGGGGCAFFPPLCSLRLCGEQILLC
jgi:hypothetical protein